MSPRTAALPASFEAQLATLVKCAPDGDEWLHELKYDGYRIGCRIDGRRVTLYSRRGNDWTDRFPVVRDAAAVLGLRRALLDGEVAVVLPDGRTSFQALQNAIAAPGDAKLVYFVFDLLHLDGRDLAREPLEERKTILGKRLPRAGGDGVVRHSDHVVGNGPAFLREACRLGAEGIVSKRRDAPYRGGRTTSWLKTKCVARQEFVIGGFTDPEGSRQGIGALLVGVHDRQGRLLFAGKVGTGFTQKVARDLRTRLDRLEEKECPFATRPAGGLGRNAHWVRPKLVAEVAFTEWTEDGKVRHPSFQGLRDDKDPAEIVREAPSRPDPPGNPGGAKGKHMRSRSASEEAEVAGVRVTHPDRELFPEIGLTKLGLARFYEKIADWILPHLEGRPLTLVRCPEGLSGDCFYMKHSNVWAPPALRRVRIREKTKTGEYLVVDSLPALISLVQMGILEIHTWNSKIGDLEHPDRFVLDLDPGPKVPWKAVVEAARLVRARLETMELEGFVKTTGSRGLHVVVPLKRCTWERCAELSRSVATAMVEEDAGLYTTKVAKKGREGKILIDYYRNHRGNTSVAAYSTRARPKAPVSVPLRWEELRPSIRSDQWTVRSLPARLARRKPPDAFV